MDARVDDCLALLEEPERTTLAALRRTIREVVPDAEECISYGMPAYKLDGVDQSRSSLVRRQDDP